MSKYATRIIDSQLDALLPELTAVSIDGAKGVGKTATALQRAKTVFRVDDDRVTEILRGQPELIQSAASPVLLDEWQYYPKLWDYVRRLVDDDPHGQQILMTGSALPRGAALHSGAGRIVRMHMRPLSLAERNLVPAATVSLSELLNKRRKGEPIVIAGETSMQLADYVHEITASGLPGIRHHSEQVRQIHLDGYLQNVAEREFAEQGITVRNPVAVMAWFRAYAAATGSTAAYSAIVDAATPGQADKPAKETTQRYREILRGLWLLDPVPAWLPNENHWARLGRTPKHYVVDPALAARLLGLTAEDLLYGDTPAPLGPQIGSMTGRLFESLIAQSLATYAEAAGASLGHFRTQSGDREVDFIVQQGRRCVAFEVKLSPTVSDRDVRHMLWLREKMQGQLVDAVVVTTGSHAYRRSDGIAVVPAALLGP